MSERKLRIFFSYFTQCQKGYISDSHIMIFAISQKIPSTPCDFICWGVSRFYWFFLLIFLMFILEYKDTPFP